MDNIQIALTAITAIFAVWKFYTEIKKIEFSKLNEDLENSKLVFREIETYDHPMLIEKGLKVLASTHMLSSKEILLLISLNEPLKMIAKFRKANEYVEIPDCDSDTKIVFKGEYAKKWVRFISKRANLIVCISSMWLFLTIIYAFDKVKVITGSLVAIVLVPLLLLLAWVTLKSTAYIEFAEELVQDQKIHPKGRLFSEKILKQLNE